MFEFLYLLSDKQIKKDVSSQILKFILGIKKNNVWN